MDTDRKSYYVDQDGFTCLHIAAMIDAPVAAVARAMVTILVAAGARFDLKSKVWLQIMSDCHRVSIA